MKKIFFILILGCFAFPVFSQDTLEFGERLPNFYYWDTNWVDYYEPIARAWAEKNNLSTSSYYWCTDNTYGGGQCPEVARYFYTDTALRIIGAAAVLSAYIKYRDYGKTYYEMLDRYYYVEDPPQERDSLILYEIDSVTGELVMLAGASWWGFIPKHRMKTAKAYNTINRSTENIYEVYFDSAITVHDSFYVSATSNNYDFPTTGDYFHFDEYVIVKTIRFGGNCYFPYPFPSQDHYRIRYHKLHLPSAPQNIGITDTLWHTIRYFKECGTRPFMCIFPIIDTSKVIHSYNCGRPSDLGVMNLNGDSATIVWSGVSASRYELSYCPENCMPETGSRTFSDSELATLRDLQPGKWYRAWVRAVCESNDSTVVSAWSEKIRFYVPEHNSDTTNTAVEQTVADSHTHIMPNPANDQIALFSSFRISDADIIDMNGRRLLHKQVDGLSSTIDISSLPKGTYIVRIETNHGTAFKKLVVN